MARDKNSLMRERELAKMLCVSVSQIQKDRCNGVGVPFIRLTKRRIRYRYGDVVQYIKKNREQ